MERIGNDADTEPVAHIGCQLMTAPLTLTFRHLPRSGALEASARDIGERLRRLNSRITACHIVLEGNAGRSDGCGRYQVKIHVSVPGAQIHAESAQSDGDDLRDVNALHSAYDNAKRQLEKLKRLHASHDFVTPFGPTTIES
jgi:ribosome-associated translation inhibitor RaiA